jgi:hypothetical protein
VRSHLNVSRETFLSDLDGRVRKDTHIQRLDLRAIAWNAKRVPRWGPAVSVYTALGGDSMYQ